MQTANRFMNDSPFLPGVGCGGSDHHVHFGRCCWSTRVPEMRRGCLPYARAPLRMTRNVEISRAVHHCSDFGVTASDRRPCPTSPRKTAGRSRSIYSSSVKPHHVKDEKPGCVKQTLHHTELHGNVSHIGCRLCGHLRGHTARSSARRKVPQYVTSDVCTLLRATRSSPGLARCSPALRHLMVPTRAHTTMSDHADTKHHGKLTQTCSSAP